MLEAYRPGTKWYTPVFGLIKHSVPLQVASMFQSYCSGDSGARFHTRCTRDNNLYPVEQVYPQPECRASSTRGGIRLRNPSEFRLTEMRVHRQESLEQLIIICIPHTSKLTAPLL